MPRDQTAEQVIRALSSWDDGQEPWHLEPPPDGSTDAERDRDWSSLEGEARAFVARYGAAAMLRCVSAAVET